MAGIIWRARKEVVDIGIPASALDRFLVMALAATVAVAGCGSDAPASPSIASPTIASPTAVASAATLAPSAGPTAAPSRTPFRPPASGGDNCPKTSDALLALLATFNLGLAVGVKPVDTFLISYQARFTPDNGADQVGPFGGFDPAAAPIVMPAGAPVRLAMSGQQFTLTAIDVELWNRADVVASDGTLLPNPGDRTDAQHVVASAGSATWTSPVAGDYVIAFGPAWNQECVTGSSLGYASVTVH